MSEYQNLRGNKGRFMSVLDEELRAAAEILPRKHSSATSIQRVFRGSFARSIILKQSFSVGEIQRVFRGSMGRKRANAALDNKLRDRHLAFLHYFCVQLQRCFRGYYSRKYKHDQHRRKLYCRMLEERGQAMLEQMRQYQAEQSESLEEEARERRKQMFETLAQNLHHLTSTRHIRGIYNPTLNLIEMPTMNALPVEEHIRGVVKDLLRTRGITKRGLVPDVNGTLKIPLKVLKSRLSVQASSHFEALKEEERKKKLHHKYASMGPKNFLGGGKTSVIDNIDTPLAVGEPYLDAWANPMLVKGVPSSQKQLNESSRLQKPLFAAAPEKPFVSRVGGNRSAALPNDLFDVIADAEETGGAIQRHLGTGTARFGLPASCDNREPVSLITGNLLSTAPTSPIRTSATLRSTKARLRTTQFTLKAKPVVSTQGTAVLARISTAMEAKGLVDNAADSSDEDEDFLMMKTSALKIK